MNKIYKVLATSALMAMVAMPMASAQDVPPASTHTGQGNVQHQVKSVPGTMGQISNYVSDEHGTWLTVSGRGLAASDQSEIRLAIQEDTKIIDAKGNKVELQSIVDNNQSVKAFYSPAITKSLPAQGQALTLIAMDYNMTGIEGTISEINERGILVEGTSIYEGYDESIILHLDPKIKIVDQQGTTLASSDLEVGMSIKSFYGPAVALSMPPQSTTNYIQVQTEAGEPEHEVPAGTEGIVTNVEDGKVTVIGSPLETGGVNYVILTVDKDTEIVDGDGKPLTADALKESVRVEAFYGQVMTMIYPAQTHADKIVVSEVSAPKIEGTITATERATKDQLYINVGSDQNTNNDVILNISEDTQVITPLGFEAELKPGTKIVAYHSPVMTKSLPPITAAEVILVQSEE